MQTVHTKLKKHIYTVSVSFSSLLNAYVPYLLSVQAIYTLTKVFRFVDKSVYAQVEKLHT